MPKAENTIANIQCIKSIIILVPKFPKSIDIKKQEKELRIVREAIGPFLRESNGRIFSSLVEGSNDMIDTLDDLVISTIPDEIQEMKTKENKRFKEELEKRKEKIRTLTIQETERKEQKIISLQEEAQQCTDNIDHFNELYENERNRVKKLREELLTLNSNVKVVAVVKREGKSHSIKNDDDTITLYVCANINTLGYRRKQQDKEI